MSESTKISAKRNIQEFNIDSIEETNFIVWSGGEFIPASGVTGTASNGSIDRVIDVGDTITILDKHSMVVVDYYDVQGTLDLQGDGVVEILNTGIDFDITYLRLDATNDPVTGALLLQNTVNSAAAFQVNTAASGVVLNVDTTTPQLAMNDNPITNVGYIDFDLDAAAAHSEGRISWNSDDKTLDVHTEVATTKIQVGQEVVVRATNKTGSLISSGSVVYISGAQGSRPTIALADATDSGTSDATIGVVASDIDNNDTGYVTTFGLVRDIDTSAFSAGDVIYLSETAGELVGTAPLSPAHRILIGSVLFSSAGSGIIFVKVRNGDHLGDLHDVLFDSPADNELVSWDSASSLWKNQTPAEAGLDTRYVNVTGDTMTGDLSLPAHDLLMGDESFVSFGDDGDWKILYTSGNDRLEIQDSVGNKPIKIFNDQEIFFNRVTSETSGTHYGFTNRFAYSPASDTTGTISAMTSIMLSGTGSANIGKLQGWEANVQHRGSGTATEVSGLVTFVDNTSSGTIAAAHGMLVKVNAQSGGPITNNYGIKVLSQTNGTNNYAFYSDSGLVRIGDALHLLEITTPTAKASHGAVYPQSDNRLYFQDGAGVEKTLHDSDDTYADFIALTHYEAEPAKSSESNIHGALESLATGQPLDAVPTNIIISKGTGKIMVVVNAGSDLVGDITVTGTSVDRDTGATTGSDTDTLTVDSTTTDGSDTDTNGNIRHSFTGAYITSKWFTGTVTLSTSNLTLTDVDVYHVSFEQFNDQSSLVLDTFDVNLLSTNVAAEFDAYLYILEVTGDKCDISRIASLNLGADGETAIANKYWRLRKGNLAQALDGTTDGIFMDVVYSNSPSYIEDVSAKVWATRTGSLTLV